MSSVHAQYDDLVLDYEQLRRENEELKLKLKEKNDLEEFEALERKAEKDQEVREIEIMNFNENNTFNNSVILMKPFISEIGVLMFFVCVHNLENFTKR